MWKNWDAIWVFHGYEVPVWLVEEKAGTNAGGDSIGKLIVVLCIWPVFCLKLRGINLKAISLCLHKNAGPTLFGKESPGTGNDTHNCCGAQRNQASLLGSWISPYSISPYSIHSFCPIIVFSLYSLVFHLIK